MYHSKILVAQYVAHLQWRRPEVDEQSYVYGNRSWQLSRLSLTGERNFVFDVSDAWRVA